MSQSVDSLLSELLSDLHITKPDQKGDVNNEVKDEKIKKKDEEIVKKDEEIVKKSDLVVDEKPGEIEKPKEVVFEYDRWISWTEKSSGVAFKSTVDSVGNGELKLATELDVVNTIGGQNSVYDLLHPVLGTISVKDMTSDSCTLGAVGCQNLRSIFRETVTPLVIWAYKYKDIDKDNFPGVANIWQRLQQKYGKTGKVTVCEGIDRFELSESNLQELNKICLDVCGLLGSGDKSLYSEQALRSEYLVDICANFNGESLITKLNQCVRLEGINHTLIIVHETKGWTIVKNLLRITCPRITRGAPRIQYDERVPVKKILMKKIVCV